MGVIIKINTMKSQLTSIEKRIAEYILKDPESIKNLNTYQVAKNCKASQASIVRFAKKLGFKGYPDFKLSLSQDIGNRKAESHINIIHEEIKSEDTFEVVGKKIAHENILAINNTCEITDFKQLENAVKAIANADKIMIAGVGFSGIVAKDLYYKLLELGKHAIMETDTHMQLSCLSSMGKKDVLFVISHSGKTVEMYDITKVAKDRGVKIISMTSIVPNPISDLANIKLGTVEMKSNFRSTALSPRISQLTVIDMIYIKLMLENKKMQDYIFNAIDLVQGFKLK
ncbi:HTH-type transcriptional regulator MurR [Fusobacterium sp. DD29]|uniref:MurR/RpiR family transcriptional regulator n=1 Tax=unclassified Fusobacterium TaxID=2648384 RepID=UPI001B8D1174|nr:MULTISPECIES: MurR/RpiR family transcriptional regulator [unclassified Fusobacterium]MBR8702177.1 HTH-type transcriptional regulator MurR [Fusobacterium sp. DD45]MBR8712000.1 HTH-type transcriptional regulator MurR [Fusobacterium sp. DD28]MBR8749106.1 HTH-type transcriptional regulator MurR [Fusobacterium sp. DD29]MBR8752573.1 HTH-type transcriptional regulator MurR [Fusobacterium sp. DD26]MBR8761372.1 HTH-type transcriptional regulator MurR [Fusobacterium sp. DD25]